MNIQKKTKSVASIDVFKFLCAIMVVGIHTQPLGDGLFLGICITTVFRVAVPFFFAISYSKGKQNIV